MAAAPHDAGTSCRSAKFVKLHSKIDSQSTCGLVAMTSAAHAEGRQFDPGQVYLRCLSRKRSRQQRERGKMKEEGKERRGGGERKRREGKGKEGKGRGKEKSEE